MAQVRIGFLPPEFWQDFQELVLSVSKREWPDAKCSALGREGQGQDGIDVLVTHPPDAPIGVQAKKRRLFGADGKAELGGRLTLDEVKTMVAEAEKYRPPLRELVIATTALTDAVLQKSVATLSDNRARKKLFIVHIWFWEDFQRHLNWDSELQRLYYSDWVEKTFGYTQEKHYLMMLRCAFSRPAFTTRLESEDSGDDMAVAISDTQAAINIGVLKDRSGKIIQRAPIALSNLSGGVRERLESALRSLDEARKTYRDGIKSGTIADRRHGVFIEPSRGKNDARRVDSLRADALDHLNAVLETGAIEGLPNYLRPPN
jgi:hypothetical protein